MRPSARLLLTRITHLFILPDCISIGTRSVSGSGSWRIVVAIGIIWALVLAVGMLFMPESPRWLAARDRIEEARRSVALSRGVPASERQINAFVVREVEQIRMMAERERNLQAGWRTCFEARGKTRYRTFLGTSSTCPLVVFKG